jgi:hypothetical protein
VACISTSLLLLRPTPRSQRLRPPLLHSSQQRRELVPAQWSPGRHGAGGGVVGERGERGLREREGCGRERERGLRVALMIAKGHIAKEANVLRSHPDLILPPIRKKCPAGDFTKTTLHLPFPHPALRVLPNSNRTPAVDSVCDFFPTRKAEKLHRAWLDLPVRPTLKNPGRGERREDGDGAAERGSAGANGGQGGRGPAWRRSSGARQRRR